MTQSQFFLATSVTIVYFLFRFIERRYITKEKQSIKILVRDSLLVYFSTIIGNYILNYINPLKNVLKSDPKIFTNDPDF